MSHFRPRPVSTPAMQLLKSMALALITLVAISPALTAQAAERQAALLLFVEGDIDRLEVAGGWRRDFDFVRPKETAGTRAWVRLVGTNGRQLARVPLDLSKFNLSRRTKGRQVPLSPDRVLDGKIQTYVKVPDYGRDLVKLEIDLLERGQLRTVGTMAGDSLRQLVGPANGPVRAPDGNVTVTTHLNNGPSANRYDIVILGDGYLDVDQAVFHTDVQNWMTNLFGREPFQSYQHFFNVHSVFRPSNERGADKPGATPPVYVDTVYDSSYWTGGVERCLYIQDTTQALADVALAPDVETAMVVFVNDPKYGGCAGQFAVTYNGPLGPQVQTHEFCHSFGGLADEYGGQGTYTGPEPTEPNVTADPTCAKWSAWHGINGVSCFEGAYYHDFGAFRPADDCLMRSSSVLCSVCVEQLTKVGYDTVTPIENPLPADTSVSMSQFGTETFSFTSLVPAANSVLIEWKVDNLVAQTGGTSFVLNGPQLTLGAHSVKLEITDQSTLVRNDPDSKMRSERTWSVMVGSPLPPADLNPGDTYRVLFLTDGSRDATSTDIADYDAFVTSDAAAAPILANLGATWKAVASTPTVNASAHVTPGGGTPIPIYRPDGVRIANSLAELLNTAVGSPLTATPNLTGTGQLPGTASVWTGSDPTGLAISPLGSAGPITLGDATSTNQSWMQSSTAPGSAAHRLYGISETLIAPLGARQDFRFGTPSNPIAFVPGTNRPVIGQTWNPRILHGAFAPNAIFDFMIIAGAPANAPLQGVPSTGLVLCSLAWYVPYTNFAPGSSFAFPVPNALSMVGIRFCTQGGSFENGLVHLANAIDITIGTH